MGSPDPLFRSHPPRPHSAEVSPVQGLPMLWPSPDVEPKASRNRAPRRPHHRNSSPHPPAPAALANSKDPGATLREKDRSLRPVASVVHKPVQAETTRLPSSAQPA